MVVFLVTRAVSRKGSKPCQYQDIVCFNRTLNNKYNASVHTGIQDKIYYQWLGRYYPAKCVYHFLMEIKRFCTKFSSVSETLYIIKSFKCSNTQQVSDYKGEERKMIRHQYTNLKPCINIWETGVFLVRSGVIKM